MGPDPDLNFPGYFSWHEARAKHNKAKKYSGGISLFIKQELKQHVTCLPSESSDILWIRIQGNLNQEPVCNNLTLGVVYNSPANSSYTINNAATSPGYQTTWEILQCELEKYKADSNICLIGDFNSHTGTLDDYIHDDDNKFTDVPTCYNADRDLKSRSNQNIKINDYGKKLVQLCQMSELRIANGRKLGDSHGSMTCHKYNGSSTVDYFIADSLLLSLVLTRGGGGTPYVMGDTYVPRFWPPFFTLEGSSTIFLGYFFSSTNSKAIFWGTKTTNFYKNRSFWPQIQFFPRSFWVQFSAASGTPPSVFRPSTPPGVLTFKVEKFLESLSDHCPISTCINMRLLHNTTYGNDKPKSFEPAPAKKKWDPFEEQLFKIRLSSPKASEVIKEIFTSPIHDAGDIDKYIEKINQILLGAASVRTKYKKKITRIHKKKHTKARTSKQWYDGELYILRQQLLTLGNSLLHDPQNSYLRGKFFLLKKYYKKEVQQKKRSFKQCMIDRLEALEKSNPKEYWQIFDKLKNSEQDAAGNSIPMDEWVHYYSQLLSPRPIVDEREALIKEQLHRMKSIPHFSELDFLELPCQKLQEQLRVSKKVKLLA